MIKGYNYNRLIDIIFQWDSSNVINVTVKDGKLIILKVRWKIFSPYCSEVSNERYKQNGYEIKLD